MGGPSRQQRRARERARAKAARRAPARGSRLSWLNTGRLFSLGWAGGVVVLVLGLTLAIVGERDSHQHGLVERAVSEQGYTLISAHDGDTLSTDGFRWFDPCGKGDRWTADVEDANGVGRQVLVCVTTFDAHLLRD